MVEYKYRIVKIGRTVEETLRILNGYADMGYEVVCAYMNGDHLILKKVEEIKR